LGAEGARAAIGPVAARSVADFLEMVDLVLAS